jgi:hypothetical protein
LAQKLPTFRKNHGQNVQWTLVTEGEHRIDCALAENFHRSFNVRVEELGHQGRAEIYLLVIVGLNQLGTSPGWL